MRETAFKAFLEKRKKEMTGLIIGNATFPKHSIPLSLLREDTTIVCCDGAVDTVIKKGIVPDAIVGDMDSISEESKRLFADKLHRNDDQEINDLTKAFNYCLSNQITNINIVSATGNRDVHSIANISLIAEYGYMADVCLISDYGIYVPIYKTCHLPSFPGQQISVFSIDRQPITTLGLKYDIKNRTYTNWWQGTLNEAKMESFLIKTEGRLIVCLEFEDEP